ncbi:MAG TPA: hypothetical protein VNZ86_15855 [Bacteroidia bacterium]|jgi:Tfp pilus assembly protein PilF|nr:hypothetical protein [Bacteroidia bacterium]
MLHRYSFSALLVTSLILGSCTSSTEVKKNDSALPMLKPVDEITALESSLAKDSSNKELKLELASRYYAAGDLVKASVLYNKVYQQDTKNLIAITNLGNIAYDNHQDDRAISYYEKSLNLDNTNLDVRCDLATSYSNINKLNKAIEMLRENIKLDPNHQKSHYNLSVILKKKGENKEAEEEMKIYASLSAPKK